MNVINVIELKMFKNALKKPSRAWLSGWGPYPHRTYILQFLEINFVVSITCKILISLENSISKSMKQYFSG